MDTEINNCITPFGYLIERRKYEACTLIYGDILAKWSVASVLAFYHEDFLNKRL